MQIRIKSFIVNYNVAYGIILILFLVTASSIPFLDRMTAFPLHKAQCGNGHSHTGLLEEVRLVLKETESCSLAYPCTGTPSLECREGIQTLREFVVELIEFMLGRENFDDSLIARVRGVLKPDGLFIGFSDKSRFLVNIDTSLVIIGYTGIIIAALAAMFALWRQGLLRETFSLPDTRRRETLLYPALMAIAFASVVVVLGTLLNTVFPGHKAEYNTALLEQLSPPVLLLFVIGLAPLVEELLFRGVILRFFIERGWQISGFLLVSTGFALAHGLAQETLVWQLFNSSVYFTLSLILCWTYVKNRNLWSAIAFHSGYNFVMALLLMALGSS